MQKNRVPTEHYQHSPTHQITKCRKIETYELEPRCFNRAVQLNSRKFHSYFTFKDNWLFSLTNQVKQNGQYKIANVQ